MYKVDGDLVDQMFDMYSELIEQTGNLMLEVNLESYFYLWIFRYYGNNMDCILKDHDYLTPHKDVITNYFYHFETLTQTELAEAAIEMLDGV